MLAHYPIIVAWITRSVKEQSQASPKGRQLKAGAWMAPKLLVWYKKFVWILGHASLCSIWISWSFIRFATCQGEVARKLVSPARRWPSRVGGAAAGETSWRWRLTIRRQGGDTKNFFFQHLFPLSTIYEKCARWRGITDTLSIFIFRLITLSRYCRGRKPSATSTSSISIRQVLGELASASSEHCLAWSMKLEISISMNKNW